MNADTVCRCACGGLLDAISRGRQQTVVAHQRTVQCGDCAYREDSPERQDDPYALLDLPSFWCHRGMRRPKEWRHPDGRVRPGDPADYQPPIVGDVPYRADGRPAARCGGWAGHAAELAATA